MTKAQTRKMMTAALTMGWHEFVASYVAAATAKKPHAGYSVRKVADGWVIEFGGTATHGAPMSASTLYGWLTRSALETLRRDADDLREVAHI